MSDTDHEATVRGAAQILHDVIRDAEAAGYRVTYPGSLHDLPKIAISETGRINAPEAAGDGFDHLGKEALVELAAARGLPTKGTKADLIAALRSPPVPTPKATTTPVP